MVRAWMLDSDAMTTLPFGRAWMPIAGVCGLVALFALLATLQYRWLGQVSEAERAQIQSGARVRCESASGTVSSASEGSR